MASRHLVAEAAIARAIERVDVISVSVELVGSPSTSDEDRAAISDALGFELSSLRSLLQCALSHSSNRVSGDDRAKVSSVARAKSGSPPPVEFVYEVTAARDGSSGHAASAAGDSPPAASFDVDAPPSACQSPGEKP